MTPDQIKQAESQIRQEIDEVYIDPSGKAAPIYDGVIDAEVYCGTVPRIMWILKEPWDNADFSGGGWSLCADILAKRPVSSLSHSTFHPMIYIGYGLFFGVDAYADMPWVRDMDSPEGILRRLAFINAKKLPGVTRGAYAPSIMKWYFAGKKVIRHQIASYSPQIIFGCSPHLPAILDDMVTGWRDRKQTAGSADFVWSDDILFVHVHHPGQTKISRECYVNDALLAVSLANDQKNVEQGRAANPHAFGTSVTEAAYAPSAPEASADT